ncbi:MFS general substrate transporter [Exidia glandulosa HHB12029]|uniref:MFS general substrate transporter n=1 Tax=Exidia glandulosa HHB12029 TaxID=1314781 RepID=A0A165Z869_EXIGL|nr:MFS general substrate transporter [Exidia glandulosa HHB12029]
MSSAPQHASTALPHHEDGLVVAGPLDATAALAVPLDYPAPERIEQQLESETSPLLPAPSSARRPWWKRPSIWWALPLATLRMSTIAMQLPAQIDVLTRMACRVHRPDIAIELGLPLLNAPGPQSITPSAYHPIALSDILPAFTQLSFDVSAVKSSNDSAPEERTPAQLCAKDPTVKKAVASMLTVLTSTGGILTMITTGWWGQRSDMWGRTTVLAVAVVAMAAGELNMLLVANFGDFLPGTSYWWLLPGSIILGILGGGSGTPSLQAYLSDVVEPSATAGVFSIWGGATFGATAIGPIFGGELIKWTGTSLSVYYFSFAVNIFLFVLWAFIVPESLNPSIRKANRDKYDDARRRNEETRPKPTGSLMRLAWYLNPAPLLELVTPLSICLPRLKDRNDRSKGYDWNLSFAALSYICLVIVSGGTIFIVQFMQFEFGWNAVQIGYWVGFLGLVRAIYLLFVLPAIFAWARPKPPAIALPGPEDQLHGSESSPVAAPASRPQTPPSLDLAVVRLSLVGDALTFFAMVVATSLRQFVAFSMGLALGAGLAPAFMSLALALSPNGAAEGGKLFGAFGVMTSFGAEVLGQWVIGGIFIATLEVWPRAFLLTCAILLALAFSITLLIRLPRPVSATSTA